MVLMVFWIDSTSPDSRNIEFDLLPDSACIAGKNVTPHFTGFHKPQIHCLWFRLVLASPTLDGSLCHGLREVCM